MSLTDRVAERRDIGIVLERHEGAGPWASASWRLGAVLLDLPETAPWSVLSEEAGVVRYYAGPTDLVLVPSESESYWYNLTASPPQIWVVLRVGDADAAGPDIDIERATVSAGEADVLADSGDLVIDAIPLPETLAQWLAAFVERFPPPRQQFKRGRSKYVSEGTALAERMRTGHDE
ncbi:MAG: DUF3305 domain-containing protein [Rhodospirillaceae bacterium]|nr:DUF3305 domain-containing protein [Rhodospirillaceae bacterium]